MIKKSFFIFFITFCLVGKALCFPALTGRVVDEAHILSQQDKQNLEQLLQTAEPNQIVAVSLASLDGKEIEEYGYQLGRHWGIGRKGINDGVLILIAPNQRQLRIEVGYGLESTLTDALCSQIVNRIMLPFARQGKYDKALVEGTKTVLEILRGQNNLENLPTSNPKDNTSFSYIFLGLILVWIIRFTVPNYIYNHFKKDKKGIENIHFSMKEKEEISKNKRKYFLSIIPLVVFYSLFFTVGVGLILYADFVFGLVWLLFSFFHSFAFIPINFISQLRKKSCFTDKEYPKFKMTYHVGGTSRGGGSSYSGGGSSFSGGGGSFGGGGSSGRW